MSKSIIFGALADAGVNFIHVTEFGLEAFGASGPPLARLAKKYAPGVVINANGSLHDLDQAEALIAEDADFITLGRGALANPDLQAASPGRKLCVNSILRPIADIKEKELAICRSY